MLFSSGYFNIFIRIFGQEKRNLPSFNFFFISLFSMLLFGYPKIKIYIFLHKRTDPGFHFQFLDTIEKVRIVIQYQYSVSIIVQIVVPKEQIFGKGIKIQRITAIVLFPQIFKCH